MRILMVLIPEGFWKVPAVSSALLQGCCQILHPVRWLLVFLGGFWMAAVIS